MRQLAISHNLPIAAVREACTWPFKFLRANIEHPTDSRDMALHGFARLTLRRIFHGRKHLTVKEARAALKQELIDQHILPQPDLHNVGPNTTYNEIEHNENK
jgi:hypothetical protein